MNNNVEFSSFRDPAGYIFYENNMPYRCVNNSYKEQYDMLLNSGLYELLTKKGLLIKHSEVNDIIPPKNENMYKVIKPSKIPFISYPYEWSFGQLKDAALTTLRIHRIALDYGMVLKDATAYNIQFKKGRAVFIDTLSFDVYKTGMPFMPYGQFCRHFLAPLLLMRYCDINLNKLLSCYIDGIPLDMASAILKGRGGLTAFKHIKMHAQSSSKHADEGRKETIKEVSISLFNHKALIDSLIKDIEKLELKNIITEWGDYYSKTNYSEDSTKAKQELVEKYLKTISPETVWDFGANDGTYSRLALNLGAKVVAFDIDPVATERSYNQAKKDKKDFLPLLLDLTNPSPAIGFASKERVTLQQRQHPDALLCLAVIHHMAISNNLSLTKIAEYFAETSDNLIIEFVPKEDSQVKILLATREDIFPNYTQEGFENEFSQYFEIKEKQKIGESVRTLYLMKKK